MSGMGLALVGRDERRAFSIARVVLWSLIALAIVAGYVRIALAVAAWI
jgi:nitrate reductase NapE component